MADGIATNREDRWRREVQWSANTFAERKPEFNDDTQKVLVVGDYGFSNIPLSSGSATAWLALVDGVHSSMDGKYFMLIWYGIGGYAWSGTWALTALPREFYITPGGTITIEPNFIDTGWNQIDFDNINLPASFNYSDDPSEDPEGGTVHVDWMRGVSNWSSASINYTKYDIDQHTPHLKGNLVSYDFQYYVCLQNHVSDAGKFPYTGSPYWSRIYTGI